MFVRSSLFASGANGSGDHGRKCVNRFARVFMLFYSPMRGSACQSAKKISFEGWKKMCQSENIF
jgi:hypothetical protein